MLLDKNKVALAAIVLIFPLMAVSQTETTTHRSRIHWVNSNNHRRLDVEIRGVVEFTDDDADVKSLSSDGYVRIEESDRGTRREYEVKPGSSSGQLQKTYKLNGDVRPLDAQGKAWIATELAEAIRESGINAAARVQRILRQGGTGAVFSEIGRIESDGARRLYLDEFISHGNLNNEDLRQSMRQARRISSDGEKARLLIAVAPRYLNTDLRDALFDTAGGISSDGEHQRVLVAAIEQDGDNQETLALALKSAEKISSDGEKARVLVEAARHGVRSDEARHNYFAAADSISSDGEHRRALSAVLRNGGLDRVTLARLLRSAGRISSDGEKAAVLEEAASLFVEDESVRAEYFAAANTISSDGEHARALTALLRHDGLAKETLVRLVQSAAQISSDGEKARVLTAVATKYSREPVVRDALERAAKTISSDGEYRRVISAMPRSGSA